MPKFKDSLTKEGIERQIASFLEGLDVETGKKAGSARDMRKINMARAVMPPFLRFFTDELRSNPDEAPALLEPILDTYQGMLVQLFLNLSSDETLAVLKAASDAGPNILKNAAIMAFKLRSGKAPDNVTELKNKAGEVVGYTTMGKD